MLSNMLCLVAGGGGGGGGALDLAPVNAFP